METLIEVARLQQFQDCKVQGDKQDWRWILRQPRIQMFGGLACLSVECAEALCESVCQRMGLPANPSTSAYILCVTRKGELFIDLATLFHHVLHLYTSNAVVHCRSHVTTYFFRRFRRVVHCQSTHVRAPQFLPYIRFSHASCQHRHTLINSRYIHIAVELARNYFQRRKASAMRNATATSPNLQ